MNNTKQRITALSEAYLKALEFGVADLNQSVAAQDPTAYYNSIVRHEKLAKAVSDGMNVLYSLQDLTVPKVG
jgi:hypothetical protein